MEVVAEGALGAAVDEKGHRVLLRRIEVHGLDDPRVDLGPRSTGKGELLRHTESGVGQLLVVHARDAPGVCTVGAVGRGGDDLGGAEERVERVEDPTAGSHLRAAGRALGHHHSGLAGCGIEGEDGMLTEVIGRQEELLRVRRPGHLGHRTIIVGAFADAHDELALGGRGQVSGDDVESVGFEARTGHGEPRQRLAVGGEAGLGVPGGIGGDLLRSHLALDGHAIEVEVGGPGLVPSHGPGGEDHRLTVGRDSELLAAAKRLGGCVGVHAPHQVRCPPACEVEGEQVVPRAIAPAVPMTEEEAIVDEARGLGLLLLGLGLGCLFRALSRQDGQREEEVLAARGHFQGIDVQGQARHGLGLTTVEAESVHLARSAPGGQEVDGAAVGRKAARAVRGFVCRQAPDACAIHIGDP